MSQWIVSECSNAAGVEMWIVLVSLKHAKRLFFPSITWAGPSSSSPQTFVLTCRFTSSRLPT